MNEKSTALEHLTNIAKPLLQQLFDSCTQLSLAKNHFWLAKEIQRRRMIAFLEYVPSDSIVESMHALFYALTYNGSREALCKLIYGLFGSEVQIIFDESVESISITIKQSRGDFAFALASAEYALANERFAMMGTSFANIVGTNIVDFFRQFIPIGIFLKGVYIQ